MRYSWNVAREVLRLMLPGAGAYREAITDFTYVGYRIPKIQTAFQIQKSLIHQDPVDTDPRHIRSFVPFGGGPRMCPGNEYARIAILVFVHNVVTKFRWEKLLPNYERVLTTFIPTMAQGLPVS
ncbi:hypothetical protein RJ640_015944 [Escallonia rubra]|uniref:Cytochrome P450 n=1 Tax=Escallonia rubra TaxID=112253 RepID=A0AA88RLM3_9ASTE|nr:hypothetical protein RJ640_015944 [Escallonia rubra]